MKPGLLIIMLAASLTILTNAGAQAFQNEPPAFRELAWGSSIDDAKAQGLTFLRDNGDFQDYLRKDDKLEYGDAQVESIVYSFYKDKLFRVLITYKDMHNYEELKSRLFFVYGPGQARADEYKTWWWFGRDVTIGLFYGIYERGGTLSYIYVPIQREREKDHLKMAKEGAKEF
ncbi:MAG: hypothetical protein AB1641_13530 [Thermodesulfobacteriota bacterium]